MNMNIYKYEYEQALLSLGCTWQIIHNICISLQLSNKAHENDVGERESDFQFLQLRGRVIILLICAWVETGVEELIRALLQKKKKKKSILTFYSVSVLNPQILSENKKS